MPRVIAVANQKGGVGKTATAVNISCGLAKEGRRVLLVDLDAQASASSGVGVRAEEGHSTYEVLLGTCQAADAILSTTVEGLDVIPSTRDLVGAEVELVDVDQRDSCLRRALKPLGDRFDYVVIDCPPALGMLTLNALCSADSVLIPLQCEFYALEGLSALLDTIARVREGLRPDLAVEGILLTMYDARTGLSRQVAGEVRQHFGDGVFNAMIPRNVRISESPSHGLPVLEYDARSAGAAAYRQAARELLQRRGDTGEAASGAAHKSAEAGQGTVAQRGGGPANEGQGASGVAPASARATSSTDSASGTAPAQAEPSDTGENTGGNGQ